MRVYTKRNTKTEQIKDKIKDNDNDKLPNLEIKSLVEMQNFGKTL